MKPRTPLFGMLLDPLTLDEAVAEVLSWTTTSDGPCKYVVTPNVDHAVLYQEHEELRRAYATASLVLADGAPVVLASRLLGRALPERVAGSDLVPALFDAALRDRHLKIYLLGAADGVAQRAAERIAERWPWIEVVGTYSPPLGFERDPQENDNILEKIRQASPDLVIVGLGAPKQELWVSRHFGRISARGALCVGASIDFLAGEKARAPQWMRGAGLEWMHRLGSEPRRLARRYARDAMIFPRLVWNEWRAAKKFA